MFSKIAKLLSFVRVTLNDIKRTDVTVDTGGGVNYTANHFATPGNDSFPLLTDYVIIIEGQQSGSKIAIGYLDAINDAKTNEGETRIYARNPADGEVINEIWLKNDGSISGSNSNGSFELQSGGNFIINGVTIDPGGNISANSITTPSAVVNGVELATHIHAQPNDGAGDTEANTTGPI